MDKSCSISKIPLTYPLPWISYNNKWFYLISINPTFLMLLIGQRNVSPSHAHLVQVCRTVRS